MPKRGFARFFVHVLQFGAVIYFFSQLALFVLDFAAGRLNLGGLAGAILFTVITYGLGILLNIALDIEESLHELLNALRRPRNQ